MLITLLAWIYISLLCWAWGVVLLNVFKKITGEEVLKIHFSFICLTGLSAVTIVAAVLSIFIALGNPLIGLLLFIIPFLIIIATKNGKQLYALKKIFSAYHLLTLLVLLSLSLLLLIMSTWTIVHPDTLGYHAQTIQWIEKYKAVPGLVHLHVRFGYQGLWFVDNAALGNIFSGADKTTFLNSTVLLWYFIFITDRINHNFFSGGKKSAGILWLLLLSVSLWSYTQVRLTATSASPDFIAALFGLAVLYLLLEKNSKYLSTTEWLLSAFLCMVAVSIKLSVAPLLIIAVVAALLLLVHKKIKSFIALLLLGLFTSGPFITRNIITTGYVIFPSVLIDMVKNDWKYDKDLTVAEKNYITAYAKRQGVSAKEEIDAINKMSPAEWMPGWWQQRTAADKTILVLFFFSFIAFLFSIKKMMLPGFIPLFVLITMLCGVIFWFINAPDPRFGFGFLLGFIATVAFLLLKEKELPFSKTITQSLFIICSLGILTYAGYRFNNFFEKDQWLKPMGIKRSVYISYDCDGISINTVGEGNDFGKTPVPCTDLNCGSFSPRGKKIEDGFRAKANP